MSARKDFSYKEEEDGEIPPLVTGDEQDLSSILQNLKSDGGRNIVSEKKIRLANKQVEEESTPSTSKKIPVTIITGYLGSGKSTLLEQIALKGSDRKIAVILNEFGDSSEIEKSLTIRNGSSSYEEWLDLGNGCLCCSLKDVGVRAIENMVSRCPGKIDYILLETSGIADPGPIAKMFWMDEGLNSNVYIDGIITVLDSEHILSCLDDFSPESHWHGEKVLLQDKTTIAHLQIAMADRILLNKIDRLEGDVERVREVEGKVKSINSAAVIYHTKYGDLNLDKILDLHAFESSSIANYEGTFHDPRISTITLSFPPLSTEVQFEKFIKNFLQVLLWKDFGQDTKHEYEIHRTKGLVIVGSQFKVIQGVRDTFDIFPGQVLPDVKDCKLVLIGKHLHEQGIKDLLKEAVSP